MEPEILIGRLIDGEADDADRSRFESLAGQDASLWQTLAQRQMDMAALVHQVAPTLQQADLIELPQTAPDSEQWPAHRRTSRWTAYVGWAAAAMLAIAWWAIESRPRSVRPSDIQPALGPGAAPPMSPEEHFRAYLNSPFVVGRGELDPVLLQIEQRPDGQRILHYLRRIEETAVFLPDAPLPVEGGKLTVKPDELPRESATQPSVSPTQN